jgi:hypothetical protein
VDTSTLSAHESELAPRAAKIDVERSLSLKVIGLATVSDSGISASRTPLRDRLQIKALRFHLIAGQQMGYTTAVPLAVLACIAFTFAQDELPTFRAQAASAFVWGEDNSFDATSSSTIDPVTGHPIYRLSHGGIEVSSQVGFERIGMGEVGELLNFTTTIVNNTEINLSVRHGGTSVAGHAAAPLPVVVTSKGLNKRERKAVWELKKMHCFSSGFLSSQNFFSTNPSPQVFTVAPKSALTVSYVTKDPRNYPLLCSIEGCYPTGTMRFAVTVNATDFVFVWPGRSAVYCGK